MYCHILRVRAILILDSSDSMILHYTVRVTEDTPVLDLSPL